MLPVGGRADGYGIITAPNHGGAVAGIKAGLPWAADVGCLVGPSFVKKMDFDKTIKWLNEKMLPYKDTCLFVAGADVVGKADDTLGAYHEFSKYFTGWPFAYVAQNGAENLPIPDDCAAVFVGGVPMDRYVQKSKTISGKPYQLDWKDSPEAISVIKKSQEMGKHIHIGRVNWKRRYDLFSILEGSESFTCDGTRTRFDGADKAIEAWNGYMKQKPLIQI